MEKIVNIDGQNKVLRLRILQDDSPTNPFEDWDCNPPILVDTYSNRLKCYGEDVRDIIRNKLSYKTLKRLSKKIANVLSIEMENFSERCEEIDNELSSATIEELSEICDILKIKNTLHHSTGYSQGDAAKVLIVISDKFLKTTGAKIEDSNEIFKSAAKLFDDWAWGDVYGFILEEKKEFTKTYKDGSKKQGFEWEQVDSCWGFFGDHQTSGILEHIPQEFHEDIDNIKIEY